jgi:hypothetical protein
VQAESIIEEKTVRGGWNEPLCIDSQKHTGPGVRAEALTIPELEQSKAAVLNTLASVHSRRSYTFAINSFIAWYVIGDSVLYHSLHWIAHLDTLGASLCELFGIGF